MGDEPTTQAVAAHDAEEHVEDLIGEPIEVGHGGLPVVWIVCVVLVVIWALCAWKPWSGY